MLMPEQDLRFLQIFADGMNGVLAGSVPEGTFSIKGIIPTLLHAATDTWALDDLVDVPSGSDRRIAFNTDLLRNNARLTTVSVDVDGNEFPSCVPQR